MKKYFYLSSLLFMVACGTTKMIAPSDADVQRSVDNFPGLTLAQLQEGQQIYQTTCNRCHPFKKPSSRTPKEWEEVIPEMTEKANVKFGQTIDAQKQESLLRFVCVMAGATPK